MDAWHLLCITQLDWKVPFGIQVITLHDGAPGLLMADVTTFLDPSLLPSFGFSPELPR